MSPTLLEGFVVLVLIVVVWQIGAQLAPEGFRGLLKAKEQVNQSEAEIEEMLGAEEQKKQAKP